ncbi:MAG: hypothetical protein ABFD66_03630 [Smithella sp.]
MNITIDQVNTHIKTLRELISAIKSLNKARDANSEIIPRNGIRGGRATTLESHHCLCAEHVERMFNVSAKQACELFELTEKN